MKAFLTKLGEMVKGFAAWWSKLGSELYAVLAGAAAFFRDEPLSSVLALGAFGGIVLSAVLKNAPMAAAALTVSGLLVAFFQQRAQETSA